ncbi:GntR family transcriptional regulator [Catenulispora sp. NF23]|uniref:sigma factor-like helix-turn-helix DNA-binding protein n=1 Tax=Catenulispora pinistramenti TaxID=2705254 RepID=UPI001BAAD30F|nr:sigma factor-like helix-turn-helix DNA-binding protein [Catenulispora pinistramenti]MBS2539260.1 GntR family transcriptional regulator [Catenulispora pinistramenti]
MVESRGESADASPVEVFEQIFREQRTFVERQFYFRYEDWQLAEDLAVELFERLWTSLSSGSMEIYNVDRPRALLRRMVEFVSWGYNKRDMREKPLRNGETALDSMKPMLRAAAAQLAVDDDVAGTSNVGAILALLPEKQRRAVALRYVADMDLAQAAEATGWPEHTVKQNAQKGLKALREAAGLPTEGSRLRTAARRQERIRRAYQDSVDAGAPLSPGELGQMFGCDRSYMRRVIADLMTAPRERKTARDQVREYLRGALADGTFPDGSLLPGSVVLARQFDTSPGTVTPVFVELESEHLVVKFAGRFYAGAEAPAVPDERANTSPQACRQRKSRATVTARIPQSHGRVVAGVAA